MSKITIIYDLETTGFNGMPTFSKHHKVLQISARCIETGDRFDEFVDPGFIGDIPPRSTKVHNIKKSDLVSASTIDVVLRNMYAFFKFDTHLTVELIAHNNDCFDGLIIMKEYKEMDANELPTNTVFWDSLPWLRENYIGLKSYNLGKLYELFFKEKIKNEHRADADVDALFRIYVEKIAPHRKYDVTEKQVMYKLVHDECLTSIRYIGPYRANLCFHTTGIETVSGLKEFANSFRIKGECTGFDNWLQDKLGVVEITDRMFIISHIYDIPLWFDELLRYVNARHSDEDCLDEIDYFVKYKYMLGQKTAPNKCLFNRGLIKMYNKTI
jgi:DNA polymerase III epsilon subunit-like protein